VSTQTLHAPLDLASLNPASRYLHESREYMLTYQTEELAALRFSIILTARWEASGDEEPARRIELRNELMMLRKYYGDKIDDIAMTFGVTQAMKVKDEVEHSVTLPSEVKVSGMPETQNSFEEEYPGFDFDV
jgi:hypothetical protein